MAENEGINCPRFRAAESVLRDVKDKINHAKITEKAGYAERLREEAGTLLSCPEYSGKSLGCSSCRLIANACKRTADIIIKVAKISAGGI